MRCSCPTNDGYENVEEDSDVNTQRKLNLLCGTNELEKITHLQLKPYPAGCSVICRGSNLLTNLSSLCLSGNTSIDLRDLGVHLPGLSELSISHCHLENLDGIASFPNLTILCVPYNNISDLSPCIYLEKMCHLDIERNAVKDAKSLEPLALCEELVSAVFQGNPFCLRNQNGTLTVTENYEETIFSLIPQLKYLDQKRSLLSDNLHSSTTSSDMEFLQQFSQTSPDKEDPSVSYTNPVKSSCLRHNLLSSDTDLFAEEYVLGSNVSFLSDRSETLSTSGKIYCGSPGRAFKSGFGSTNMNAADVASVVTEDYSEEK